MRHTSTSEVVKMPKKVHECVKSVLEDNPDYSESKAWAICNAQFQAEAETIDDVVTCSDLEVDPDEFDAFASQSPDWEAVRAGVWLSEIDDEAVVAYDPETAEAAVSQQADPMANGHQLDPSTGEGICESTGETIHAETMEDLSQDCPHCGEPLSVLGADEQQKDGLSIDVFRIVQDGDDGPVKNGALLGIGADMPNAGVYVDWNIAAWPEGEQLSEPHVSDYGSLEDLEQVASGPVEVIETVHASGRPTDGIEQQAAQVDAVALAFPPGGEVIDHDEGDWGVFLDDLSKHGDPFQMWKGIQRHPDDDLESHDHTTYVALDADSDITDIESVLEGHPAVHYTIDTATVGPMDRPDDWNPSGSEHYHGTDTVDQQAVVVSGLSNEAIEAIDRRYSATVEVVDGVGSAAPTDH